MNHLILNIWIKNHFICRKLATLSCKDKFTKMALEEKYPDLCKEVDAVMKVKSCKNMQWNGEGFLGNTSKTELFKNKILKYMSENLAWIELYIREPYCELIIQETFMNWY